jgi:hypothetical protein
VVEKVIPWRLIGYLAALVGLVLLVGFTVRSCDSRHNKGAQSRVERSQGEAHSNSAADAVNTVAASGEASAASEELTRQNEKDIRNAKGSNAAVDPAARDAGLRALCLRRAYRDDAKCRVFQPHP